MKNLKSIILEGLVSSIVVTGLIYHIGTYQFGKSQISKAERDGSDCAETYCKSILNDFCNKSKIFRYLDGRNEAAAEYLFEKKIINSGK